MLNCQYPASVTAELLLVADIGVKSGGHVLWNG